MIPERLWVCWSPNILTVYVYSERRAMLENQKALILNRKQVHAPLAAFEDAKAAEDYLAVARQLEVVRAAGPTETEEARGNS